MNELKALLDRLKVAQTELVVAAAKTETLPSDKTLAKLADLELAIAAVENEIDAR